MQFTTFTGAAVLLALLPSVFAGTARVVNNCPYPVYFASVPQGIATPMTLLPSGGYSEGYGAENVGVSIKLAPNASGPVTQFEFTPSPGKINYDISNIDGNPFAAGGMVLTPSMVGDSNNPTCQVLSCPAGQSSCSAAYNQPDDVRTMVCDAASDLTMTLCPGGSGKRSVVVDEAHAHRLHARHLPKRA